MTLKYNDFLFSDDILNTYRKEIYHSQGNGFVVLRDFLPPQLAKHIQLYWSEIIDPNCLNKDWHYKKDREFFLGHPNVYKSAKNDEWDLRVFHNYVWNYPEDEVTHQVAYMVLNLINQIERRPIYWEFFPFRYGKMPKGETLIGQALSYRIIQTFNKSDIKEHKDYAEGDSHYVDPGKLNASLILSDYGKDYTGEGMIFTKNTGERLILNRDLDLKLGDLVIWRYCNTHGIRGVESEEGQLGFMRAIFPREFVHILEEE